MFLPVALEDPCRHHAGRNRSPGGDASGARQGTSQDTGKATAQTNKASLSLPCTFPALPCGRYAPSAPYFFCHRTQKAPFSGSFFMRCRFRTKRSQQNRAGGMEGILPVARRPPPAYQRPWRGLASADNTRWGWKGWKKRSSSRAGSDCMAAKGHSRGNEGSCGQRRQQRKLPLLPGYATQAVSFRRATMPRRASSATTFSAKTGSMASASGERPTCMVRQSKG